MFLRSLLSVLLLPLLASAATPAKEVTVYSVYDGERLAPIFKPFTDRTGIKVTVINDSSEKLIQRLQEEGAATQADLHLDKDLVYLGKAQQLGLYRPFNSQVVEANIPGTLIESQKNWFLLFYRARIIMYNRHKVNPSELSTYEALGDSKWQGRLCVRTSKDSYNQALGAFFVYHYGEKRTAELLSSWVKNFATAPLKNDREVIRAIAEGKCDVGIANSYYLAPFVKADPDFAVRPFFPNQNTTGTHINGVGIGIVKHAKNVAEATLLLEYLTSKEVQAPVASAFSQYPANPAAPLNEILVQFGAFKADLTNIGNFSPFVDLANSITINAGYR